MIRSAREEDLSAILVQMRRYYAADGYRFDEALYAITPPETTPKPSS